PGSIPALREENRNTTRPTRLARARAGRPVSAGGGAPAGPTPARRRGGPPGGGTDRAVLAAGEGALAGLAAGAVLGAWDVRLSDDLAHGTRWLAAERLVVPALACA